ncbi:MAG: type VII toxin-antitoxin system MntA family adenylyltransferase antitoxin [bacterium]
MIQGLEEKIISVVRLHPEIKLVYLFGSRTGGETGPLSDYDIAVYADERDKAKLFNLKLALMDEIGRALGTDRVDIVMLNLAESPELKYHVIKQGKLLYEEEPFQVLIEPKILNEYFDFHESLIRYKLTAA